MRLPNWLIVVPIILSLSPSCHAIPYLTPLMELIDYAQKLLGLFKNEEKGPSEIQIEFEIFGEQFQRAVANIRDDVEQLKNSVSQGLKDLPSLNGLVETQRGLQMAAGKIEDKFNNLRRLQSYLNRGNASIRYHVYQEQVGVDNYILDLWSEVKNVFLIKKALSFLTTDFLTAKLMFESVCEVGVSQLQLIEELFKYFQTTSTKVFLSRHIIYNYFDKYHSINNTDSDTAEIKKQRREDWNKDFYKDYFVIRGRFLKQLESLSPRVWRCDPVSFPPIDHLRLKAFTKIVTRGPDVRDDFGVCGYTCMEKHNHSTQAVLDDCMSRECSNKDTKLKFPVKLLQTQSELREHTRGCLNPLAGCKLKAHGTGSFTLCLEKNTTRHERYTEIIQNKSKKCDAHNPSQEHPEEVVQATDMPSLPFDCVCPETYYYVSTLQSEADKDHVIVGAQIQKSEHNILYIKVRQGKPMYGGVINPNSTKWLNATLNNSSRQKITWGDCDEFDLSEITLPKDRVIVGLGFTGCVQGRIHLRVTTKTFDLKTGTVGNELREEELIRGTILYSVNNTDVPTRSRAKNHPINLKDGDYVKLALSSLELDGGQNTVPFIDYREVAPPAPVALSGASLLLRGQQNYGGFLGIQLFTFNVFPHLPQDKRLKQSKIDELLTAL